MKNPDSLILTRRTCLQSLAATVLAASTSTAAIAGNGRPDRFIPPKIGSTWSYRRLDGEIEEFERLEDAGWNVQQVLTYKREAADVGPAGETQSYNRGTGSWLVTRTLEGKPLVSAEPDDRRYRWPLTTGARWRTHYKFIDHIRGRDFDAISKWRVDGQEMLASPLGPLRAIRLIASHSDREQRAWFAPTLGIRVREEERVRGQLTAMRELASFAPPPKTPPPSEKKEAPEKS